MKVPAKTVEVLEVANEGLFALLGKRITVFCNVYIYTGILAGVNDTCIKLEDAAVVYETGEFSSRNWKDAQKLPNGVWYVATGLIESFGELK